jgi:hypothetical protein
VGFTTNASGLDDLTLKMKYLSLVLLSGTVLRMEREWYGGGKYTVDCSSRKALTTPVLFAVVDADDDARISETNHST